MLYSIAHSIGRPQSLKWLILTPVSLAFVCTPLFGWLADARLGNYRVFRVGTVLLFISTVLNCLLLILETQVLERSHVLKWIQICLMGTFFAVGGCACIVTALPLGLDQMPDGSSSNITSYIAWFVCSIFIGGFLGKGLSITLKECLEATSYSSYFLIWALILTLCMSAVLVSNFYMPKWLIIEPESPQSLKTFYQALKFAAKHKAPLNRSAFTYWEEDVPSRLDLGKSKYGGPFTTEQVEDVKTMLRLIVISLPFSLFILSVTFHKSVLKNSDELLLNFSNCQATVVIFLVSSFSEYGIFATFFY